MDIRIRESVEQEKQRNQRMRLFLRWLRTPLAGYLLTLPLVGVALLIPLLEVTWGMNTYFIGSQYFIVTACIGLIWGLGPALLSVLLSAIALQWIIIPPTDTLLVHSWMDELPFLSFLLSQLVVLVLIIARERTRQSLFLSEQEVRARAEALAMSNQALVESKIRLEQLDQLKDRFIAQASHELKTPVTTIQGQVQLALRRLSQQKELPNSLATLPTQLEKIETQTHRLHSLIDDLLDLSSLRAGSLPLRKSLCNITQLCRDVVEEQIALTARHIDLDLPATPQFLDVDAERLSQVVINLVTNAIKYSSEGTVVQVSMRQESAYLLLQVHNIGSSIPKEQQAHIFEPFYRSPNARSSSKPGWGLGLAISKDIVERHGGRIWVESEEAKGTTFFVCLPTQSDQEKGEERKPEEQ